MLQFVTQREAAEERAENNALAEQRGEKLLKNDAFRVPEARLGKHGQGKERGFKQKFSGQVHQVAEVDGTMVVDEKGQRFRTRFVLPVPADSTAVTTVPKRLTAKGGSDVLEKRRLAQLEPFRAELTEFVGEGVSLKATAAKMRDLGMPVIGSKGLRGRSGISFKAALELLGFRVEAGRVGPAG